MQEGEPSCQWHTGNLTSGIYLYRFEAGKLTETGKLVLIR